MVHRVRILDPTLMFPKSFPSADMESMVFFKPLVLFFSLPIFR